MTMTGEHPEELAAAEAGDEQRARQVRQAVDRWTKQLIDLTGRNQLLYYRTLTRGTLELSDAEEGPLAALLGGRPVRLSQLLPTTAQQPDRHDDALRRSRTLHRKAVELFEERGIQTLYLAWGMASWTTDTSAATPAAPVLLRPVAFKPRGAAEADFDVVLEGDWEVNATLLHLLATEFRVDANEAALNAAVEQAGGAAPDISRVYELLRRDASEVPDFSIASRLVVGTFTYMKQPMVRDLQEAVDQLGEHDLIAAMAGVEEAREAVRALHAHDVDPSDPDGTPPADEFLILDADASQAYAINSALAGESLVVQGPPGTGKSQTIANLIAALTARGKRVLFVAEKRAAIDAVTKRLHQVGLDQLVLDLHGGTRSKQQIAQDLAASIAAFGQAASPELSDLHHELERTRADLRAYMLALHEPREPWALSAWEVIERLLGFDDGVPAPARWRGDELEALDAATARAARAALEEWTGLSAPLRDGTSPWVGANVASHDSAESALQLVVDLMTDAPATRRTLEEVGARTSLPHPGSVAAWSARLTLFSAISDIAERFDASLWDDDLDELADALAPGRWSLWARMRAQLGDARYRAAKKAARRHWRGRGRPDGATLGAQTEAARQQLEDWQAVGGSGAPPTVEGLADAQVSYETLSDKLRLLADHLGGRDLARGSFDDVGRMLSRLESDQLTLFRLPRIVELEQWLTACRCDGLLQALHDRRVAADQMRAAFDRSWLESIRSHVMTTDRRLATFDGDLQRRRAQLFVDADVEHIATTPRRAWRAVAEHAVETRSRYPDQDQTVAEEAKRKRRHLPLRRLVERAPEVVTAVRPCWAMSPLVVSQTLPRRELFDVVIFDEASQVTPADAVPALARARQVVVAGDNRQLPPTAFFGLVDDDADDGDEEADATEGFESILDTLDTLLRDKMLTWHYRSEDETLVAFSNHHIYDGGLTTFPAATDEQRLEYEAVPHRPGVVADSRSNDDEVARVVDLMFEHARRRSSETLGVIALGVYHADRIEALLRERLDDNDDPDIETFFDEAREERAFVKNLERVQGDERDAIILSTGYAKTPDGRLLYRFGPLNQEGGERRLNVAVTRARKRLTVVSSFSHTDMRPDKGSRGARLLRSYLKYVASGGVDLDGAEEKQPLDAFERSVLCHLERAGLEVIPQYGTSGFRIDFAIQDPDEAGRMLVAVETDGASYRSSPTARDRDRLRRQVLEGLGWRFHRLWASDWFNDPERETAKVVEAVERAQEHTERPPREQHEPEPPREQREPQLPREQREPEPPASVAAPAPEHKAAERGPRPPVVYGSKIQAYGEEELVALARWIASDGLLRTDDELFEAMMAELGFSRRGKRIVEVLTAAIRQANR